MPVDTPKLLSFPHYWFLFAPAGFFPPAPTLVRNPIENMVRKGHCPWVLGPDPTVLTGSLLFVSYPQGGAVGTGFTLVPLAPSLYSGLNKLNFEKKGIGFGLCQYEICKLIS